MTRHNLPTHTTTFVDRTQEIAESIAFLHHEDCRLLTFFVPVEWAKHASQLKLPIG